MSECAYNSTKNINTGYMSFELHYIYYPHVFFENKLDSYLKSCSPNELAKELRKVIFIYQQNLFLASELKKRAQDESRKFYNFVLGKKIWLNSKYIKTM